MARDLEDGNHRGSTIHVKISPFNLRSTRPRPQFLKTLKAGFVLDVKLQTVPHVAVQLFYKGNLVGALSGKKVPTLVNCLQNTYKFKADVVSISGGNCQVEVRPA